MRMWRNRSESNHFHHANSLMNSDLDRQTNSRWVVCVCELRFFLIDAHQLHFVCVKFKNILVTTTTTKNSKMVSNWLKVSLLLCIFGFFRELRPSEPFSTEFFIGFRNLTTDEITQILYPLGTYSYMIQLIIVFLVTDMLRWVDQGVNWCLIRCSISSLLGSYKAVIIFSAFCGCMVFALMLWMDEFIGLIFAQIFYGTFMATEIAYYTYIYAKVERNKYQRVTGHTRSAILAGRFLGAAFAQLLITFQLMNYRQLNFLSFGCKSADPLLEIKSISIFQLYLSLQRKVFHYFGHYSCRRSVSVCISTINRIHRWKIAITTSFEQFNVKWMEFMKKLRI